MRKVLFILAFLALSIALVACPPNVVRPEEQQPACLYELTRDQSDAGPADGSWQYVVQGFGSIEDCRTYERLCNRSPENASWPRCSPCCSTCEL